MASEATIYVVVLLLIRSGRTYTGDLEDVERKSKERNSCLRKRPKSQQKIWASCAHLMLPQLGKKKASKAFKNLFFVYNTYTSKLMLCLDLKMNYIVGREKLVGLLT